MAVHGFLTDSRMLSVAFAGSALTALLLALTQRWHGRLTLDLADGVQKAHTQPTSRVGGLALVFGLTLALAYAYLHARAPGRVPLLLDRLCIAGAPAFAAGRAEDLSKRVGVSLRLLATMASGVLACAVSGVVLRRVDIGWFDALLQSSWIAVPFTGFAVGGVANAINIVDGFNGLAGFTSLFAFAGYALLAGAYGDTHLMWLALLLGGTVLGFLLVNWPGGLLFLGDGGAYFTGFALAWVAVLLVQRHPGLSAFAVLLVLAHPVIEVLFSMFRRRVRHQQTGMPDRLHFHSLFKRRCVDRCFRRMEPVARNSLAGAMVGSITLLLAGLAWLTRGSVAWAVAAFVGYAVVYVTAYARMVRYRWCSPWSFLLGRPHVAPARRA